MIVMTIVRGAHVTPRPQVRISHPLPRINGVTPSAEGVQTVARDKPAYQRRLTMSVVARPRQYRIILRGECGPLMAAVLDVLLIESCHGWTCVTALVQDESELYGLLDWFQDFALHVVSLNELGADVLRSQTSGQRVESVSPRRAASAEWLKGVAAGDPAILEAAIDPATDNIE